MTLQQKKSIAFGKALDEFQRFKAEWRKNHPNATEEEYNKAIAKKAEELDL